MALTNKNRTLRKSVIIFVWGITLFAVGFGISFYRGVQRKFDQVQIVPISEINLSGVENGTYTGTYIYETMSASVDVIVRDEAITKIVLTKLVTEEKGDVTPLIDEIVKNQSVMVDDIEKAVNTSRVVKLAVVTAFSNLT